MNPKIMMLMASIIGTFIGDLFISAIEPGYDYIAWLGLFAIIGVGAGNMVLLILHKILKGQ